MISSPDPVLIFPCGSEIGMEIFNSLRYNHHVNVFGATSRPDHAALLYESARYAEDLRFNIGHPEFLSAFSALLLREEIRFIYPTHDSVALFLSEHQDQVSARVLTAPAETNRIARYKDLTHSTFVGAGIMPERYTPGNPLPSGPLFLKPADGQGGKGTFYAETAREANFYLQRYPNLMVYEYLPGEEVSVDCFTNFNRELLFIGARARERVTAGISFRSWPVQTDQELQRIAEKLNSTLVFDGAWFFQAKRDRLGRWKLLEFAPRQSSTMGLYRFSGVNFALLSLFNARRQPVTIHTNPGTVLLDRALLNRFAWNFNFRHVYIDLDETLIFGSRVNEAAIAFLYRCRNRNIRTVLLTKHRFNVLDTLRKSAISEHLFDRIIVLPPEAEKAAYISEADAIFIDNHFPERKSVAQKCDIPVFDVDVVPSLLGGP